MDIYSAMQEDKPVATYKKTILGKLHVVVLDPFDGKPKEVILTGDEKSESARVSVWDNKQKLFFERINKNHFEAGRLVMAEDDVEEETSPNQVTDEEIDEILKMKFMAFRTRLYQFTDVAPLFRILKRAREIEKSERIINHIQEAISRLQNPDSE